MKVNMTLWGGCNQSQTGEARQAQIKTTMTERNSAISFDLQSYTPKCIFDTSKYTCKVTKTFAKIFFFFQMLNTLFSVLKST